MKKIAIFSLIALMLVGIFLSTAIASAYKGDFGKKGNYSKEGPFFDEERHELMKKAFLDADYEAWKYLMKEDGRSSKAFELVTEENFETFVKAHEAAMSGDYETAIALRNEIGLNQGKGYPKERDFELRGFNKMNKQKLSENSDVSCIRLRQKNEQISKN
jgi:hypothetical protein